MLEATGISTGYDKKQVLYDVSFSVREGEIVLLAGSNGSGKSTLLKALIGQLPLWNGSVHLDGQSLAGRSVASKLNLGILYVPQRENLFQDLTVGQNLSAAGLLLGKKTSKERLASVKTDFPSLERLLDREAFDLSGGEHQMVALAMASLHRPRYLLIDEPLNGLSPQTMTGALADLKRMADVHGTGIVIVEHRIRPCLALANRIVGLKLGKVFCEHATTPNLSVEQLLPLFT